MVAVVVMAVVVAMVATLLPPTVQATSAASLDEQLAQVFAEHATADAARHRVLMALTLPFDEARARRLFGIGPDQALPATPRRTAAIQEADFRAHATRGQPLIVQDTWPALSHWSCAWFQREFGNETVEGWASYDVMGPKGEQAQQRLDAIDFSAQQPALRRAQRDASHEDPANPTVQSWFWFPINPSKDGGTEGPVADRLRALYDVPYFIPRTAANRNTILNRFEAFFGTKNSGVDPHVDDICQFIFSSQMSGAKHWRLAMAVDPDMLIQANPGFVPSHTDAKVLHARMVAEHPIYSFTLRAGEAIFFPPGMIHTTRVVSDECSMSFSLQFTDPSPVHFVRDWHQTLLQQGCETCFEDSWNYWLFGGRRLNSSATRQDNVAACSHVFALLDANGDGAVDAAEMRQHLSVNAPAYGSSERGEQFADIDTDADSFVRLHDRDGDARVTYAEFAWVCHDAWTPRALRVAEHSEQRASTTKQYAEALASLYATVEPTGLGFDAASFKAAYPRARGKGWRIVEQAMDFDSNGRVSPSELMTFVLDSDEGPSPGMMPDAEVTVPLSLLLLGRADGIPRDPGSFDRDRALRARDEL